ncbi:MAG: hypothetical protein AAF679_14995 [Pseudomonadota bacterium]
METVFGITFVLFAGVAIFAGVHNKDIEEGRMPAPVQAYMVQQ